MQVQNEVEAYLRQAAQARGLDPDTVIRVVRSEGGLGDPFRRGQGPAPKSQAAGLGATENSFGPLQLYISGTGAGLGDRALKAGIDPRTNWQGGVDFALDEVARDGWKQWYGAAKAGVGRWDGVKGAQPVGTAGGAPIDAFAGVNPTAAADSGTAATAYAPETAAAGKSPAAGILAIQNLMNAAQPEQIPVPSLNAPTHDPAVSKVPTPEALTEKLPAFQIDRPFGSMPEPAWKLPSSVPDDPGLLDRILSGDVGGFREGVQDFEQGAAPQAAARVSAPASAPAQAAPAGFDPAALAKIIDAGQTLGGIRSVAMQDQSAAAGAGTGAKASASVQLPPVTRGAAPTGTRTGAPAQAAPFEFPSLSWEDIMPTFGAQGSGSGNRTGAPMPAVPGGNTAQAAVTLGAPAGGPGRSPTPVLPQYAGHGPGRSPTPVVQTTGSIGEQNAGGSATPQPAQSNGGFAALPDGPNAPKPTAKPTSTKTPFNTVGFLGALGSIMAAFDQGSPELSGVSLSAPMHKPEFGGLAMPKGLL